MNSCSLASCLGLLCFAILILSISLGTTGWMVVKNDYYESKVFVGLFKICGTDLCRDIDEFAETVTNLDVPVVTRDLCLTALALNILCFMSMIVYPCIHTVAHAKQIVWLCIIPGISAVILVVSAVGHYVHKYKDFDDDYENYFSYSMHLAWISVLFTIGGICFSIPGVENSFSTKPPVPPHHPIAYINVQQPQALNPQGHPPPPPLPQQMFQNLGGGMAYHPNFLINNQAVGVFNPNPDQPNNQGGQHFNPNAPMMNNNPMGAGFNQNPMGANFNQNPMGAVFNQNPMAENPDLPPAYTPNPY